MGVWSPNAGEAMRYRNSLGRKDIQMYYNISAEFAYSLDRRTIAERAESTVFSSIPDAVLVSGQITGQLAKLTEIKEVSKITPKIKKMAGHASQMGKGGMISKIDAAEICLKNKCAMVITSGKNKKPIRGIDRRTKATWFVKK